MKRISGILAIVVPALVLSSGRTASALAPQAPRSSNPPEKTAAQVPVKTTQATGKTTQVPDKATQAPDKATRVPVDARAQMVRCAVPDLGGLNISAAKGVLEKAHLSLGDEDHRRDSHRTGTIIAQSAQPGAPVKCGSAIGVVTSIFVDTSVDPPACQVKVPDLLNADMQSAEKILAGQKLKLGDVQSRTDTRTKGTVVGQLPPRGTPVTCGSTVNIFVAVPPEPPPCPPIKVPSVIGRDQQTGIKLLNQAGIRVRNIDQVKSDAPTGTILRQLPPQPFGKCEASIDLIVAEQIQVAPPPPPPCPPIKVPSVVGRDQQTGIELLNQARIRVRNIDQVKSDAPTGTILRQSPPQPFGKCEASIDLVVADQIQVAPPPPPPPPPPPVVVPSLTGQLQADALDLIRAANLSSGTIGERQSGQKPGIVVEQRPAAGTPVPRGTPINIVVAIPIPVKPVTVPDLIGQRPENVGALLGNSLRIGSIATRESNAAAGVIVDQSPAAGQSAPPGSTVNVWIATPAPPVKIPVPDLRGRNQNEAAAAIQGVKLLVGPVAERESTEARGIVVEQIPGPGELVDPGTAVSLWLAAPVAAAVQPTPPPPPPVPIVVPRVVEGSLEQALIVIRAAGLQPGTVTQTPSSIASGIVTFQTPAAGTQVTPGTPIDLIVAVPLAPAETPELPLIWLSAGLFTGLLAAAATASVSRARKNRLAGTPTLVPHVDEGQQTSEPGDGSLVEFEMTLDAHADPGVQMLEEKPGLIAGEWSGAKVMSW